MQLEKRSQIFRLGTFYTNHIMTEKPMLLDISILFLYIIYGNPYKMSPQVSMKYDTSIFSI
jgi:hypothetical protein